MNIGSLEFQMMADMSQLKRDMDDCKRSVTDAMGSIDNVVGIAKNAFIGFIGVASVSAFAGMIKGSIDATGGLKDLAIQTGASEAAMGRFRAEGSYTNTGIDTIAGSMNKLSKNMVGSTEDSKGAAAAVKALGLDFNTFKQMKPEDQMLAVATSMSGFADGAEKGTVAQALFGKEGAKLLPFLADLGANAADITAKLTDQEVALKKTQAAMADAFGDNLIAIRKESDGWKKDLANGMIPALYDASQAFIDVTKGTGGLKGEISALSRDGTITSWSRSAITGITYVMDVFSGLQTVVKSVGVTIGAWAASVGNGVTTAMSAVDRAVHGDFKGAMDVMDSGMRQQKTILSELGTSLDETWGQQTLGSKLRDRMDDLKATGMASEKIKPQLDHSSVVASNEAAHKANTEAQKEAEKQARALAAEIKKMDEAYGKLNSSIGEKITAMEQEMLSGEKLTESDKIQNKLLADLASSTLILTDEQLENTIANINNMAAVEARMAAYKEDEAQIKANTAANNSFLDRLEKGTTDIEAQIEQVKTHTSMIGLNKEELAALTIKKDLDRASTLEQKAAWAEQNGLGSSLVEQYRTQAAGLRDLAALKEQGIHVQAARDADVAWQKTTASIATGLGNALGQAVMQGKDLWLTFRDFMVQTILAGQIKNALTSVISEGINYLTSAITGIKIGSTGSTLSTGSSIASTASTVGSVLTGGTSIANGVGTIYANATGGGIDALLATNGAYGTAAATTATGAAATGAVATGAEVGGATVAGAGTSAIPIIGLFYLGMKALGQGQTDGLPSELELYRATHNGENPPDWIDGQGGGGGGGGSMSTIGLNGGGVTNADTMTSIPLSTVPNRASLQGPNSDMVRVDGAMGTNLYWARDLAASLNDYGAANGRAAATQRAYDLGATESILDQIRRFSVGVPQFVVGGDHMGGLRIVGENGPELEATGPSRIFNAEQTASMLRSGGASDSEVVAELRLMRLQIDTLITQATRGADALNGNGEGTMVIEVAT